MSQRERERGLQRERRRKRIDFLNLTEYKRVTERVGHEREIERQRKSDRGTKKTGRDIKCCFMTALQATKKRDYTMAPHTTTCRFQEIRRVSQRT